MVIRWDRSDGINFLRGFAFERDNSGNEEAIRALEAIS
jgi:hypothetical protein